MTAPELRMWPLLHWRTSNAGLPRRICRGCELPLVSYRMHLLPVSRWRLSANVPVQHIFEITGRSYASKRNGITCQKRRRSGITPGSGGRQPQQPCAHGTLGA